MNYTLSEVLNCCLLCFSFCALPGLSGHQILGVRIMTTFIKLKQIYQKFVHSSVFLQYV